MIVPVTVIQEVNQVYRQLCQNRFEWKELIKKKRVKINLKPGQRFETADLENETDVEPVPSGTQIGKPNRVASELACKN